MRLSMETATTGSEATSRPTTGRQTPRRNSARRCRETPSKSRSTTPRSSPSRYPASPRKTAYTPIKMRGDEEGEGPLVSNRTLADMQMAKRNYLGGLEWAKAEEQLFEILFLRQDIPLLPLHWEVDFRGVPISGDCFCCKKGENPIIYAHTSTFLGQRLPKYLLWPSFPCSLLFDNKALQSQAYLTCSHHGINEINRLDCLCSDSLSVWSTTKDSSND